MSQCPPRVPLISGCDAAEIECVVSGFASADNGGHIVTTGGLTTLHHELISALSLRHKLPAVYPADYFVTAGEFPETETRSL